MDFKTDILHLDHKFPLAVFRCSGFSPQECESGVAFMHRHRNLELTFCTQGNGRYIIGDCEYPINKGDLFIINDLEYHQSFNDSGQCRLMVLVFDTDLVFTGGEDYSLIRAFYECKSGFKHRIAADSPIMEDITPLMNDINNEWSNKEVGYQLVIKALLLQLLAKLYRGFERTEGYAEKIVRFQNRYERLAPAIAMIKSHFAEPLTLDQLADCVHMNRNYFSTLFSSLMGNTVSEYIVRRRLGNAAQLLVSTDSSIISISLDSGFRNVSYFNRAFNKQYGMSPSQYRQHF